MKGADGRIEKHPDSRIREALELVFRKFAELGSVRQVLLWFRQETLALPSLEYQRGLGQAAHWRLPVYNTIHKILCNPIYAGAYAFGRTLVERCRATHAAAPPSITAQADAYRSAASRVRRARGVVCSQAFCVANDAEGSSMSPTLAFTITPFICALSAISLRLRS